MYRYDPNRPPTDPPIGGNSTTYNPTNQLNLYTTIGGANLTYWGNGTLHGYNSWSYTYDAMNRLTVATNGTITANFYYDGLNRQIARSITGEGTTFNVWDGWQLYAEFTTGNVLSDRWIYGAGGDLVMSPIQNQYYYPDGSGSTSYLAGSLGYLLETYTYDAFGTVKALDANDNALTTASVSLLYNGQKWYSQLGLYDLRHRAYLPSLGRFLQPDPIGFAGDASNTYRYCGNNPVNLKDAMGTIPTGADAVPVSKDWFWDFARHFDRTDTFHGTFAEQYPSLGDAGGGGDVPVRRATDVNGYYADGTPSFQATELGKILASLGHAIGFIWNLPNDVIGLGVEVAGLPFGGEHWGFEHGALEITGNRLISSAITIGEVINYGRSGPDSPDYPNTSHLTWEHEVQHIPQGEVLGPLYLIAHLLGGIAGEIENGDWHGPANPMEVGPMGTPPSPWGH